MVGRVGRRMLKERIPYYVNKYEIDFVIANGENATHGKGLNRNHYFELLDAGVDVITLGGGAAQDHPRQGEAHRAGARRRQGDGTPQPAGAQPGEFRTQALGSSLCITTPNSNSILAMLET